MAENTNSNNPMISGQQVRNGSITYFVKKGLITSNYILLYGNDGFVTLNVESGCERK